MPKSQSFIGFPEGMLLGKPVRLPVLENTADLFALNKLPGLVGKPHPWFPGKPDVCSAIRHQISLGKGELERLNIERAYSVYSPEPDLGGPMVFAKHKVAGDCLKNALGSDMLNFTYYLVTASRNDGSELKCDLPIASNRNEPRATISHKYGKKSSTQFNKIKETGALTLWRATTIFPRMDQIRLHAFELGIPAIGDCLYGPPRAEFELRSKRTRTTNKSQGQFSGVGLALIQIDISRVFPEISILEASLPRSMRSLLVKSGLLCED
jgi:23S rRNA-/tRNA-specific pseudouridylate synthase